ncbi:mitochondrial ribonuclease P catalytic subunit-like [Branchiostoma lanceolatum]|uniref:mitochondrial ribonuclease P catalytic subunit-like n=1 Tax=Branchiostoma lanceolatum TaxID=7740 RepID=UPI003456D023
MPSVFARLLCRQGYVLVQQGQREIAQRYGVSFRGTVLAHRRYSSSVNDNLIGKQTSRERHGSQKRKAQPHLAREVKISSSNIKFYDIDAIDSSLTPEEWGMMKAQFKHPLDFERKAMERLLRNPSFSVAESLMTYIAEEGRKPRYGVLYSYLAICVKCEMYGEMFKVYAELRRMGKMLDPNLLATLIKGFCGTDRWKESLEFLKVVKVLGKAYSRHYNHIIIAAMEHGEKQLGMSLFEEMMSAGLTPSDECYGAVMRTLSLAEDEDKVYSIFERMRNNVEFPSQSLALHIKEWFEGKKTEKWTGAFTSIHASGHCRVCDTRLEGTDLTDEEFQLLHDSVLRRVIHGKDIFRSTTPKELKKFLDFIKDHHDYDVVVDGLNVAYTYGTKQKKYSRTLLKVVEHLVQQLGLRVLVLGRKHMKAGTSAHGAWRHSDMDTIESLADLFLTDDVSKDDPYLLSATLSCGPHARFISGDFMRDHKALLDQFVQRLFLKWLRGHQMKLLSLSYGAPIFSDVHTFDIVVQQTQNTWHFPYEDGEPRQALEGPDKWLCVRRGN